VELRKELFVQSIFHFNFEQFKLLIYYFFEYKVNGQYQEHKAYGMIPSKGFVFKKSVEQITKQIRQLFLESLLIRARKRDLHFLGTQFY
jgi:hypothetical protein